MKPIAFSSAALFEQWLEENHATAEEVWVRIYKKASGLPTVTALEAIDVVLCWGWIDAIRKSLDEVSFVQRYCPRRPRSIWSQVNRDNVARLGREERMRPPGLRQVEMAKADGRWANAYAPVRSASAASLPPDLKKAINASARAKQALKSLDKMDLFALGFRVNNMKTAAGRETKIRSLVELLEKGGGIRAAGK